MSLRMPSVSDFSAHIQPLITIVPPSVVSSTQTNSPTNILILLHGLGDSPNAFVNLAKSLNLPNTAYIVLRGHAPLPFDLGGWHWGDDIQFDPARPDGGMDLDTGFSKSVKVLAEDVINSVLLSKCSYTTRQIILFGFGQGGMAAFAAARALSDAELGGVVSIGGPLPDTTTIKHAKGGQMRKSRTPVLVCHGSSQSAITNTKVREVKDAFENVQIVEWSRPGDGMMQSRQEMMPVMRFFAARLRSPAPPGTLEVAI